MAVRRMRLGRRTEEVLEAATEVLHERIDEHRREQGPHLHGYTFMEVTGEEAADPGVRRAHPGVPMDPPVELPRARAGPIPAGPPIIEAPPVLPPNPTWPQLDAALEQARQAEKDAAARREKVWRAFDDFIAAAPRPLDAAVARWERMIENRRQKEARSRSGGRKSRKRGASSRRRRKSERIARRNDAEGWRRPGAPQKRMSVGSERPGVDGKTPCAAPKKPSSGRAPLALIRRPRHRHTLAPRATARFVTIPGCESLGFARTRLSIPGIVCPKPPSLARRRRAHWHAEHLLRRAEDRGKGGMKRPFTPTPLNLH